MSDHDTKTPQGYSRREFVRHVGAAWGMLPTLATITDLSVSINSYGQCDLSNPFPVAGNPQPWRLDCRPIRPRRPATTLGSADVAKLRDAYKAMRALPSTDPRSFYKQASLHNYYCIPPVDLSRKIHYSWKFFPWHRAYLYFHERILGKLVGDMNLRLPYWDWENPAHRRLPTPYALSEISPGVPNDLYNPTRDLAATEELPEEGVGAAVMEAAMTAEDFSEFGGSATEMGIPENDPHASPHSDTGGDMAFLSTAACDPVFYAHHANMDKLWSDWNAASPTHTNPTDNAFRDLTWNFYDEEARLRSIRVGNVLNHRTNLRYEYGPLLIDLERIMCFIRWRAVQLDWSRSRTLRVTRSLADLIRRALQSEGRVRLHLRELRVPTTETARYRLYLTREAAATDPGPSSDQYLGSFGVVIGGPTHAAHERDVRTIVMIIPTKALMTLAQSEGSAFSLAYVRVPKKKADPTSRTPIPVEAKDVFVSIGASER